MRRFSLSVPQYLYDVRIGFGIEYSNYQLDVGALSSQKVFWTFADWPSVTDAGTVYHIKCFIFFCKRLFFFQGWMDVDCPLVINSRGEILFQTRPGKRNTWSIQLFASTVNTLSISTRQEIKLEGDIIMGSSLKFCHNGFIDIKHWRLVGG